jgi:hypothetical protein
MGPIDTYQSTYERLDSVRPLCTGTEWDALRPNCLVQCWVFRLAGTSRPTPCAPGEPEGNGPARRPAQAAGEAVPPEEGAVVLPDPMC